MRSDIRFRCAGGVHGALSELRLSVQRFAVPRSAVSVGVMANDDSLVSDHQWWWGFVKLEYATRSPTCGRVLVRAEHGSPAAQQSRLDDVHSPGTAGPLALSPEAHPHLGWVLGELERL